MTATLSLSLPTGDQAQFKTIGIPPGHFRKMSLNEYVDYLLALPREALQNSDDAGASLTRFVLDYTHRTLLFADDGCGMNRDTLENKFLVLGESFKPLADSVGGFGKAKELLLFSWAGYHIRTGNLLVQGSGAQYLITEIADQDIKGTEILIQFQDSDYLPTVEEKLLTQLIRNQPKSKVHFTSIKPNPEHDPDDPASSPTLLTTTEIQPLKRGKLVREIDYNDQPFAKIHLNKSHPDSQAHVRIRGICMFSKHIGDSFKHQVVIELQPESVGLMTANRDGLQYWAQKELDKLLNEMVVNSKTAVREKTPKVDYYEGDGLVQASPILQAETKLVQQTVAEIAPRVDQATSPEELEDVLRSSPRVAQYFMDEARRIQITRDQKDLSQAKAQIRKVLSALNYRPDFIVKRNAKLPKSLAPETWSKPSLKLAVMWETVVKHVLVVAGKQLDFAVGWTTDHDDVLAEVYEVPDKAITSILLNPNNQHLFKRNFDYTLAELLDLAIREVVKLDWKWYTEYMFEANLELRRKCRGLNLKAIVSDAIRSL